MHHVRVPFTVKADFTEQISGLREFEKRQLPFVVAATLTNLAQEGQAATKSSVRKAFQIRNTFTEQGIRIRPANKKGADGMITADVHTQTENRATGAPDYLGRQEDGGERIPYGGRQHIAVPTKYLRHMVSGAIPTELRPANLLNATGGRFEYKGRKGQTVLGRQRVVKGFYFFLVPLKSGALAIMGRYVTDRRDAAFPFYILTREVHVKKSQLRMAFTVKQIVSERLDRQWEDNWKRLRIKGFKV